MCRYISNISYRRYIRMNQNVWGPHLWFSLHTISFTYPIRPKETDKEEYKSFFVALQHVIPCSVCKKNYKRHLQEFPVDAHLNSRKDLVYWVIDLHNMVNSETGKRVISYEDAIKRYEDAYKKKIALSTEDEKKCGKDCAQGDGKGDGEGGNGAIVIEDWVLWAVGLIVILLISLWISSKYKFRVSMSVTRR